MSTGHKLEVQVWVALLPAMISLLSNANLADGPGVLTAFTVGSARGQALQTLLSNGQNVLRHRVWPKGLLLYETCCFFLFWLPGRIV